MYCAKCGKAYIKTEYSWLECCGYGYLTRHAPLTSDAWWPIIVKHGMYFYPNYKWNYSWKVAKPIKE